MRKMKMFAFLFSEVIFCFLVVTIKAQECGIGSASEIFGHFFDDENMADGARKKRSMPQSFIIGGKTFTDGAFPWVVYLKIIHDGGQIGGCTGTVVSSNYILTAKHCTVFTSLESITIYYGSANRQKMISQNYLNATSSPGFNVYGEDIALIKVENPIEFNENVSAICLSKNMKPKFGGKTIVAGFGYTFQRVHDPSTKEGDEVEEIQMNVEIPNDLNAVKVDILEDEKCICNCDNLEDIAAGIKNGTEVCGGGLQQGTLTGDSGGPMMILDTDSLKWFQVGITARGATYATNDVTKIVDHGLSLISINDKKNITFKFLGVYTDISKFCDWIESNTNNEVICDSS